MDSYVKHQTTEPILLQNKVFQVVERIQIGRSGKELKRQVIKHPGAVAVVPILSDGRVAMIRQFRIAVEKEILEIPAGLREPNEEPDQTAKRELIEETGYRCGSLEKLCSIYTSPGILQEEIFIFLAKELTPGQNALEDGERIVLEPKTWTEIDALIDSGEIQDAKTLAGLFQARRALKL